MTLRVMKGGARERREKGKCIARVGGMNGVKEVV